MKPEKGLSQTQVEMYIFGNVYTVLLGWDVLPVFTYKNKWVIAEASN